MKALSLWQPWATLWLLRDPDEKLFETRNRYTHVRGPLLVHAAQKRDGDVREALESGYWQERLAVHGLTVDDLAFGALIGIVRLTGCCRMDRMPAPSEREYLAGNWAPDRFAWERGVQTMRFEKPIPWKAKQGFFEVPATQLVEVGI